ncbi:MAG: hypothetical protein ACPGQV_01650 [Alphaproteobacteria bacterium]
MADDSSANSEDGPVKFRAIFEQGLDFAVERILRRAESQGGNLSASDVREELQRFKADPGEDTTAFFNEAWRECTFAAERLRWDKERRYPFERLMVNTFVHLFPTGDQVPVQGEHLSRRIIPGFVVAMLQMLGEERSNKHEDFCRTMVSRMKSQHGTAFNWKMVHEEPDAAEVVSEVLITICHHFIDLKKRRRWLTDVINGNMGAPTAAQDIPFEDMECHRLIAAMYQPLRDAMNTPEGEERITERYGRDKARMLRAVFAEITRDHRELSLGLGTPSDVNAAL